MFQLTDALSVILHQSSYLRSCSSMGQIQSRVFFKQIFPRFAVLRHICSSSVSILNSSVGGRAHDAQQWLGGTGPRAWPTSPIRSSSTGAGLSGVVPGLTGTHFG